MVAYRVAPAPGRSFAPVREVAAVASEIADLMVIHRDEAQEVVEACRQRVVAEQGTLTVQQSATLARAQGLGFVLEIFDGCVEAGISESMHIVVVPDLPLYVSFPDGTIEAVHLPTLEKLARGLGYKIEPVDPEFLLETLIMSGGVPVASA